MKKTFLFILLFCLSLLFQQIEGVCHKCELIREYNKNHPENNYYWYDDYLKEKGDKQAKGPEEHNNQVSDSAGNSQKGNTEKAQRNASR